MRGFSYCGKWLDEFGDVYYVPEAESRNEQLSDYEMLAEETEGKDGGYLYGYRVKPKEFELSIYYENLERTALFRLIHWFDRRQKGELIFESRPYAAYCAVPNGKVELQDYREDRGGGEKHHGRMTVRLTAYDPFATLLIEADHRDEPMGAEDEILLLSSRKMPAPPTESSKSFLFYNPGTETSPVKIRIAGDADEMTIRNKTTGQTCIIRGMTKGITTDAGRYLEVDSETGRVELVGASRELAFDLHDGGYRCMAGNLMLEDDIDITYTQGSATVKGRFARNMEGKYVWLDGAWRKLATWISDTQMGIDAIMARSGMQITPAVVMNEIEIEGGTLSHLEIECKPKVR